MAYEVTVRNSWGEKIVRRYTVDDPGMTVREIIDDKQTETYAESKIKEFIKLHGRDNLKYFWFPDAIPAPPPPEPKPEPVGFDMLVNAYSV